MSQERAPQHKYVKSTKVTRNRNDSVNTFQMLNEMSDYEGRNSRARLDSMGRNEYQEDNYFAESKNTHAQKLRELYREFGDAINSNKKRNYLPNGQVVSEVCLHDVLMDMYLLAPDT